MSNTENILQEIKRQVYLERAKIAFTEGGKYLTVGLTTELYGLLRPAGFYEYNVNANEETIFGAKVEIVVGEGLRFWIMKDGCTFKFSEEAKP